MFAKSFMMSVFGISICGCLDFVLLEGKQSPSGGRFDMLLNSLIFVVIYACFLLKC